jgi:polysaccharide transporter, PST family
MPAPIEKDISIFTSLKHQILGGDYSIKQIRRSRITHNIIALYGTQIAAYFFPLITVPYLARVLGPFHWGMVAFSQALGVYLSIIVEFGFQLSASRQIAQKCNDRERMADVVAGVMGAKALLAVLCLAVIPIMQHFMLSFQGYELILWAGSIAGIGQGFTMIWFYQGIERLKTPAALDILAKACAAAGVYMFVHNPSDAWKVLALQCICYCGVSAILLIMVYTIVPFRVPTAKTAAEAIRDSTQMFLFRGSVSLYTTANTIILGAVATPIAVGFYSGVERPIKAMQNLLSPISQSLYPRLNSLISSDRKKAIVLVRISLAIMALGATLLCIAVLIFSPTIVRIILGPGYEAAVPVMRILSFLLPAIAVSSVLGIQWMLPLGMDKLFNKIILSAGLLNLVLGFWWASLWQHVGMACAVVVVEVTVTISMWVLLARHRLNPFTRASSSD